MRRLCTLAIVLSVAGSACDTIFVPPPADPTGPNGTGLKISVVVPDTAYSVAIAVAPDGRVFYTEKETGKVRIVTPAGTLLATSFADVPVVANSERGLLGIALHPDFASNGYVYVFYTRSSGDDNRDSASVVDNRVVRFTADGDVADGDEELIVSLPATPGPRHNGGNLHFGPDGKLYVTLGDLADSANSQDPDVLPGRILRYNDDGTIPTDNPFGGTNPTFALGLRNSFDFDFDPVSGTLFASENGTNETDEVNRLPAAANGGWPHVEGVAATPPVEVVTGDYVDPVVATQGVVVPTGIAFAPDDTFGASPANPFYLGEFNTGRIIRYTLNDDRTAVAAQRTWAQGFSGGITDLTFAPDGSMYVCTTTAILKVTPAN